MDINRILHYCDILYGKGGSAEAKSEADGNINVILDSENSYELAPALFDSGNKYGIMFACILMKRCVQRWWNTIPEENREQIKNYMASTLIEWAEQGIYQDILPYLANALAAAIIREWPQQWPDIVEQIIDSAMSSEGLMKCNLTLLSNIAEDVKEFSDGVITSNRLSQLNLALNKISPTILDLIQNILQQGPSGPAADAALKCLAHIIKWMDPKIFFTSDIFVNLTENYLPIVEHQEAILIIFADFANNDSVPTDRESLATVAAIFESIIQGLSQTLPEDEEEYADLAFNEAPRANAIIYMLNAFISHFLNAIEENEKFESLNYALIWSVYFMEVVTDATDIFKYLCDMWQTIARHYYFEARERSHTMNEFYQEFFPKVRRVFASKMVRPPEINFAKVENGEYQLGENSDKENQLYKSMHEAMNILTHIDKTDTIDMINEMIAVLKEHAGDQEFTPELCSLIDDIAWTTGAISGAIPKADEKAFILGVLMPFLEIFESRSKPEERARIGSGIMFICSKYPRFLTSYFSVLKIIIEKLFEFMVEEFPGVKETAVSAFKTIAEQCKRSFVYSNGQDETLFQTVTAQSPPIVASLEERNPLLAIDFYDALSKVAATFGDESQRVEAVGLLMEHPNETWAYFAENFDVTNPEIVIKTTFNLKYVAVIAANTGTAFHLQFMQRFETMVQLYSAVWEKAVEVCNETNEGEPLPKALLEALGAVASVIGNYCKNDKSSSIVNFIQTNIIPAIGQTIVQQYAHENIFARVPEVLTMIGNLTERIQTSMTTFMADLYNAVYAPTIFMVKDDQESFVPFRLPLVVLADLWIKHCYTAIFQMDGETLEMFYGSIMWAMHSPQFDISKAGIETMRTFFNQIQSQATQSFKNAFYEAFYIRAIQSAFEVLTDSVHKFVFSQNVDLIRRLLMIQTDQCDPAQIGPALVQIIDNRDPVYLTAFVDHLISIRSDLAKMREALKDFLIELKDYMPDDKELDLAAAEEKLRQYNEMTSQLSGIEKPPAPADEDFDFTS